MAGVNKVIIIGRLGADPEVRYLPNGDAVCNCSIATSEAWKDKQTGEKKEATEWHRVVFFGKVAEIAGEYLRKGSQAYVEGKLQTRKWTDQGGVERYTTEIRAERLQLLGGRDEGGQPSAPRQQRQEPPRQPRAQSQPAPDYDSFDDDIPF